MKRVPLILASSSPRRANLMKQAGLKMEVLSPNISETRRSGEKPSELVSRLSEKKAESVSRTLSGKRASAVIFGADTVVVAPDGRTVLGKPRSKAHAERMLRSLSGKEHTVLTGYCILYLGKGESRRVVSRVISTRVKIRPLKKEVIRKYVSTGEPMDKAGAYAAQGLGCALIEKIEGSYTNVVGLPVSHVLRDLETGFGIDLYEWIASGTG